LVASHLVLKPAKTKGGDVFTTYLAITRLVCTALMIAFLQKLQVKAIPRVIIGIVIALAWSVAVLVTIGNFIWNAIAGISAHISKPRANERGRGPSADMKRGGSTGSILEKGESGSSSSGRGSDSMSQGLSTNEIEEVARGRPANPTPENNIPFDPSNYAPYPISPAPTVTTMDPPSVYSRDSGTLSVGSLLPRRWSFSFSQPGSPAGSSFGHQRNSLTPSPLPSSSPSDGGSLSIHAAVSRNTSLRMQQHQPRHEDIQEEEVGLPSSTTTRRTS
jgi:hypothetical protein